MKESLMSLLTLALVAAVVATVYAFIGGLTSMVSGGEVNHHSSEQWMVMRIGFQLLAVVLLLFAVLMK
ncbi:MAG: hypothetical protein C0505_16210 [Leptothrix sp. (in: Bacteria)]|nr:hypothetical protein [Leptothrix sp. (in: b-proteobacteria)]